MFTRQLSGYLEDDEYKRLQLSLALDPEAGDVMAGTGGCRKLRWADRKRGKGKRGGIRVIYVYIARASVVGLIGAYAKNEKENLTSEDKKSILKIARWLEESYGG